MAVCTLGSGSQGGQGWVASRAVGTSGQQPTQEQGDLPLGRGRLREALQVMEGREETTGLARSQGKGVSRSSEREAGTVWRAWENLAE